MNLSTVSPSTDELIELVSGFNSSATCCLEELESRFNHSFSHSFVCRVDIVSLLQQWLDEFKN